MSAVRTQITFDDILQLREGKTFMQSNWLKIFDGNLSHNWRIFRNPVPLFANKSDGSSNEMKWSVKSRLWEADQSWLNNIIQKLKTKHDVTSVLETEN